MNKKVMISGLVLLVICAGGIALYVYVSSHRGAIEELKANPLITIRHNSIGGASSLAARDLAARLKREGIDAFAAYLESRGESLSLNLAYVLLVSEDERYLSHAEQSLDQKGHEQEVQLWVFVLMTCHDGISDHMQLWLTQMLSKSRHPGARLFTAERHAEEQQHDRAAEGYVGLLEEKTVWGARAAVALARNPMHHGKALAYLWSLLDEDATDLMLAGFIGLGDIYDPPRSVRDAFNEYLASPSEAKARRMIVLLKENLSTTSILSTSQDDVRAK